MWTTRDNVFMLVLTKSQRLANINICCWKIGQEAFVKMMRVQSGEEIVMNAA
jgi:hypothetical protein